MKVAIIGADGQLGTDLVEVFRNANHPIYKLTYNDIRVENIESVKKNIKEIKPDVILNTAAFHDVPKCEEMVEQSFLVNSIGALNIAKVSSELGSLNIYYSTDYVFNGKKSTAYIETDSPNPLNVYSTSKLMGEVFTSNYSSKGIVIRISGIYGKVPSLMKGNNFITMILQVAEEKEEIKVVTDEILSPTPTEEIAKKTLNIVGRGEPGIYHLACEGQCSWFEFTRVIFDTLGITKPLLPTTSKEFGSQVKRPKFSVLENRHYNTLFPNDPMPHWKDALINFLNKNYRRNQL